MARTKMVAKDYCRRLTYPRATFAAPKETNMRDNKNDFYQNKKSTTPI